MKNRDVIDINERVRTATLYVRVAPGLKAAVEKASSAQGQSTNEWIGRRLAEAVAYSPVKEWPPKENP